MHTPLGIDDGPLIVTVSERSYTLTVYATQVPGETDIEANTYRGSWTVQTILGETNGGFKSTLEIW